MVGRLVKKKDICLFVYQLAKADLGLLTAGKHTDLTLNMFGGETAFCKCGADFILGIRWEFCPEYTIETDMVLSGSGSGYHAKLVACTATSAVSFGIQYDKHARAPYTGKAWFMIENVAHNGAGGQNYIWVQEAARDKTYHVMLTVKKNGTCSCYINGKLAKTVKNSSLANTTVYLRVEGSARLNGDSVNATFSNIELKADGKYYADKIWGTHDFTTNKGIKADASGYAASKRVTIKGKVKGLASGQDWDSAYEQVSGIIQFVN